jgi:hypothetical protein
VRLAKCSPVGALLDLQSKVECQQYKTAHLELHLHILLELLDLAQSRAHDDEVINVHLNNELASIGALEVESMLVLAVAEPTLVQGTDHLPIPRLWSLT